MKLLSVIVSFKHSGAKLVWFFSSQFPGLDYLILTKYHSYFLQQFVPNSEVLYYFPPQCRHERVFELYEELTGGMTL